MTVAFNVNDIAVNTQEVNFVEAKLNYLTTVYQPETLRSNNFGKKAFPFPFFLCILTGE